MWEMPGKKSKARAAVQAPGDPHPPAKPAHPCRSTHEPTKQVVDEYVNVAGTGIQVLDWVARGFCHKEEHLPTESKAQFSNSLWNR